MQVKLVYDGKGGTELLKFLQLEHLPTKGEVLDMGGGAMLEVMQVTLTPESMFQKAVALVRALKEN
jgi:hypothetical protein